MSSEMEELIRAVSYAPAAGSGVAQAWAHEYSAGQNVGNDSSAGQSAKRNDSDAASAAVAVSRLIQVTEAAVVGAVQNPPRTQTSSKTNEPSVAQTVLQTAEMITGVGPIVTGLMKLFGSREPEPLPELEKFVMPTAVSVEAGLSADRGYRDVRYSQGAPQLTGISSQANRNAGEPNTIQVNIQAIDSQSFLDRQEDIAKAVREAMLHSNSLNDIVMEL